jgi:four helix bundle protein
MHTIDDIQSAFTVLMVDAMDIGESLPETIEADFLAAQLARTANSAAAHYADARSAASKGDFFKMLGVVFKELDESEVWAELIQTKKPTEPELIAEILDHCALIRDAVGACARIPRENPRGEDN